MQIENKKTKVAFISIFSYPLFNEKSELAFGGAEVQISLISRELARDDNFDVSVVVVDTGQDDIEMHDNVKVIKSYKRGRNLSNLLKAPFLLYKTLKKINPDVLVCRAAGVEVGISAIYARLNKKKFVYSIASNKDLDGSRFLGSKGKIFKFGLMSADILVSQSKDQLDLIKKEKKLRKKEAVLIKNSFKSISSNTQDYLFSPANDLSHHSDLGSESKKLKNKYILWVGRAIELKRPEIFLKLAEEVSEYYFLMILPEDDKSSVYKKIIADSKNIKNLKVIGRVPFGEIQKYYNEASLFVNTSTHEGFPNTFIQSCMHGTPVISLKVNPDNFLGRYICGISCKDDYEKIKSFIEKIMKEDEYLNELAVNAKKYFKENHDIKYNITKWKEVLRK